MLSFLTDKPLGIPMRPGLRVLGLCKGQGLRLGV